MSTTADALTAHPIADFTTRLHARLDDLAQTQAWSMSRDEQRSVLMDLTRGQARIEELRLRVLAAGDRADIAADTAATSTGAWLAHATRSPRSVAHADVTLATALDEDLAESRDALAAGVVDGEQVRVIARAVHGLPEAAVAADPTLPVRAEKHLLALALEFDARALKHLARHVLEVLDPDAADVALGKKLEAEERAAARRRFLELVDNGDGTHTGRFRIDTLHAAILRKALEAFTQPSLRHRHPLGDAAAAHEAAQKATSEAADRPANSAATSGDPAGGRAKRPRPEVLGQAFCELIERQDPTRLPRAGGVNATVVVLLDFDKLLSGLGTAQLDTGERISAGLARRLACGAGIIPAVYRRLVAGGSVVLDMGRRRRLYTEAQRIALDVEQGGCTAEACDRPAAWCDAHHDVAWSEGGPTDLANGRLLCRFHHGKAHSLAYRMERLASGQVRFHRRT
jgi:uncharacterized protein DUF222